MKSEVVVLRFTGRYVVDGARVFSTCNEAPVVGCGDDRDAAHRDLKAALELYVGGLQRRGELARAVDERRLPVIVQFDFGEAPEIRVSPPSAPKQHEEVWLLSVEIRRGPQASVQLGTALLV